MFDRLVALIVDESKWLTASMAFALLAVALEIHRQRLTSLPARSRVLAAMNLFFGVTIGTMAFGHLLAVTTKLAVGTLEVGLAVVVNLGLFVGSLVFLASGQSFEQFRGAP